MQQKNKPKKKQNELTEKQEKIIKQIQDKNKAVVFVNTQQDLD